MFSVHIYNNGIKITEEPLDIESIQTDTFYKNPNLYIKLESGNTIILGPPKNGYMEIRAAL